MLVTTRFVVEKAVEQSNSKEKVYISFHGIWNIFQQLVTEDFGKIYYLDLK
jgi:hypothetical protein